MRLDELHSLVFWVEQFRRIHPSWVSHQVAKQTIKGWGAREAGSFFPAVLWAGTAVGDCCPPWCAMEKAEALKKEEGGKRYLNWYKPVTTGSLGLFKNAWWKNRVNSVFLLGLIPSLDKAWAVLLCRLCMLSIVQRHLSVHLWNGSIIFIGLTRLFPLR